MRPSNGARGKGNGIEIMFEDSEKRIIGKDIFCCYHYFRNQKLSYNGKNVRNKEIVESR